jgi:GxxExxY protein
MALVDEGLTRSVIGAFYEVYNKLGYGLLESPYVGALQLELGQRGHRVEREVPLAVEYKGTIVGSYRADLIVEGRLLVEVKADACVTGFHERQLRNYLRCCSLELGLLLVFGIKPEFRRFIHTKDFKGANPKRNPQTLPPSSRESALDSRPP